MAGGLRSIKDLVSEAIARQGHGDFQARGEREKAWREVLDKQVSAFTALGKLSRGCLHVTVADAVTLQELAFCQATLLEQLQARLPDHHIRRLAFRVGHVGTEETDG